MGRGRSAGRGAQCNPSLARRLSVFDRLPVLPRLAVVFLSGSHRVRSTAWLAIRCAQPGARVTLTYFDPLTIGTFAARKAGSRRIFQQKETDPLFDFSSFILTRAARFQAAAAVQPAAVLARCAARCRGPTLQDVDNALLCAVCLSQGTHAVCTYLAMRQIVLICFSTDKKFKTVVREDRPKRGGEGGLPPLALPCSPFLARLAWRLPVRLPACPHAMTLSPPAAVGRRPPSDAALRPPSAVQAAVRVHGACQRGGLHPAAARAEAGVHRQAPPPLMPRRPARSCGATC